MHIEIGRSFRNVKQQMAAAQNPCVSFRIVAISNKLFLLDM
jgi:hypothetical protein